MFKRLILLLACLQVITRPGVVAVLDKNDPATFNHQYAEVNGIRMHYIDENPTGAVPILLIHGFPDLWLGWREQIAYFSQMGYRVIAPTMRGYGETEAPEDPNAYRISILTQDMASLLDHLQIPTVTVIGHDWGGYVSWFMPLFFPDRISAVASIGTSYYEPTSVYETFNQTIAQIPTLAYQLYFVTDAALAEIDGRIHDFLAKFFNPSPYNLYWIWYQQLGTIFNGTAPIAKNPIIADAVFDYYVTWYTAATARGGLDWYKQHDNNYNDTLQFVANPIIEKPALLINCQNDTVLLPAYTAGIQNYVPNVEVELIDGAMHWVMWQLPDQTNQVLGYWLAKVAPLPSS